MGEVEGKVRGHDRQWKEVEMMAWWTWRGQRMVGIGVLEAVSWK